MDATTAESPFGINVNQVNYLEPAMQKVQDAGIGWVRMDFTWNTIDTARGKPLDWSQVENTVAYANTRGIRVFATLAYTPKWATRDTLHVFAPDDMQDWRRFVDSATTRYAGRVAAWGVWNEANHPDFFRTRNNYADYDSLVALAAGPVHAAGALLVAGDMVYGPSDATCTSPAQGHIDWMNARLAANSAVIDVFSVHAYLRTYPSNPCLQTMMGALPSRMSISKPVWLTETGPDSEPLAASDADQADHLWDAYQTMQSYASWWKKTFYFHLYVNERDSAGVTLPYRYGILNGTTLGERPAYKVYRLIANGCTGNPDCVSMTRWYKYADHMYGPDPNEGYPYGYTRIAASYFQLARSQTCSTKLVQIYRCWRQNSLNQHFLTTNPGCDGDPIAVQENLGGVFGVRVGSQVGPNMVPLHRLVYGPNGAQLITTSEDEKNSAIAGGYTYQGIMAYAWR